MSKRILYRAIWLPSLLGIIGMTLAFGTAPAKVPTPGALTTWEAGDKSFSISRPDNWRPQSMGAAGTSMEVWFEPANYVYLGAKSDLAGSLFADISRGPAIGGIGEGTGEIGEGLEQIRREPQKSPTEKLHLSAAESLPEKYKDYEEGPTTKGTIDGKEAIMTEFTFKKKGLWGDRPMAGKRVTMLSNERRMTVFSYCPENLKAELFPVFDQMINSFKEGQGQS